LPVILTALFAKTFTGIGLLPVLASIAVILGHSKSIFLKFTGGKSVASGVGTILALNWQVGLIIALIWSVVTFFTRYVSVGSIVALAISPFLMWIFNAPVAYVAYCAIGALYIIWLHRSNIQRLIKGEENKVR
jgi:glycerol-3-phosphate acyltransferase PlsY